MKHKRIISLVLTVAMMLSICMTGFAVNTSETDAPAICTCETQCTEGTVNSGRSVCGENGADLNSCKGEEITPPEPECTCETKCEEGAVNADCPVCSADGADLEACTGVKPILPEPECTCETKCAEGAINAECPVCSAGDAELSACTGDMSITQLNSDNITLAFDERAPFTLNPDEESNLRLTYLPVNNGKEKTITLQFPRYFDITAIPPDTEKMTLSKESIELEPDEYWSEEVDVKKVTITVDGTVNTPLELSFHMQLRDYAENTIGKQMWKLAEKAPELPFQIIAVLDEGTGQLEETTLTKTPEFDEDIEFTTVEKAIEKLVYIGDNDVFANDSNSPIPSYDEYIMRLTLQNSGQYHYPIQINKIVVPSSTDIEKMSLRDSYVSIDSVMQEIEGEPYAVFEFTGENESKGSFWDYTSKMDKFPIVPRIYDFKEDVVTPNNTVHMFREGPIEVTYTYLGEQKTISIDTESLKLEEEYYTFPQEYLSVSVGPTTQQIVTPGRVNSLTATYSYVPTYDWDGDGKHVGETKIAPTYEGEFIITVPYEFRPTGLKGDTTLTVEAVIQNLETNNTRTESVTIWSGDDTQNLPQVNENERIQQLKIKRKFYSDKYDLYGGAVKNGVYYFIFSGYLTEEKESGDWQSGDKINFTVQAKSNEPRLGQTFDVSKTCTAEVQQTYDQLILQSTSYDTEHGRSLEAPGILLSGDEGQSRGVGIAIYAQNSTTRNTQDYTDVKIELGYTGSEGASLFHKLAGISLGSSIWSSNNKLAENPQVHYKTNLNREGVVSSEQANKGNFLFQLEEDEYVTAVWITMDRIYGETLDRGVRSDKQADFTYKQYYKNSYFAIHPLFSHDRTYYDEDGEKQNLAPDTSSKKPWQPGGLTYTFTCAESGGQQSKGTQEITSTNYRPKFFLYEYYSYRQHPKSELVYSDNSRAYYGGTVTLNDSAAVAFTKNFEDYEKEKLNQQPGQWTYTLYLELAPGYEVLPNDAFRSIESKKLDNGNMLYQIEIEKRSYIMERPGYLTSNQSLGSQSIKLFVRPDAVWGDTVQPVVAMAHDYGAYFNAVYGETVDDMKGNPPYRIIESFESAGQGVPDNWELTDNQKTYLVYKQMTSTIPTDQSGLGMVMNYSFVNGLPSEQGKFMHTQRDQLALKSYINIDELGMYDQLTVEYSLPSVGEQTETGVDQGVENQMSLRLREDISVEKQETPLSDCTITYLTQSGESYEHVTEDNKNAISRVRITFNENVRDVLEVQMELEAIGLTGTEIDALDAFIGIKAYGKEEGQATYITPVPFRLALLKTSAFLMVFNGDFDPISSEQYGALELKLLDQNLTELKVADGNGGEKPIEFTYQVYADMFPMGYAPVPGDQAKYIAVKDISTATQSYVMLDMITEGISQNVVWIDGEKYYYIELLEDFINEDADEYPCCPLQFVSKPKVSAEILSMEINQQKKLPCEVTNESLHGKNYELIYELLDDAGNVLADSDIASLDSEGNVTALKEGSVKYRVIARTELDDDMYVSDVAEARIVVGDPEIKVSYTVEHYLDGVHQTSDDITVKETVKFSEIDDGITVTADSLAKQYTGYELKGTEPSVAVGDKVADSTVIKRYFEKLDDPMTEIQYTVEHYLDGVHQTSDDITVKETVKFSEIDDGITVTADSLAKQYTGYELKDTEPSVAVGDKVADGTVIKRYFEKLDDPTPLKYTLTYESNGGTTFETEKYNAGTTVVLEKVPTKDGYTFQGWCNDVDLETVIDEIYMDDDKTVYAKWEKDSSGGAHHPEVDPDDKDDDDDDKEEITEDEEVPLAETPWLNTEDHYAYIIGYSEDGTVRPNANITRAEVATIFFRLLTDEARDQFWSTSNSFSDVAPDAWYNNAVSTMVNAGIIQGYEDGTFRPNNNITRAEFAAIASRFMSSGYDVEEDLFTDIANHWARQNINDAAMTKWINGYPDGTFLPDKAITRAEAVTLVNNVLQRKPDADHMLDSMTKWPDNPESAWYYEAIQEATNSHDYDLFEDAEYETWTALQENRDWAALEKDWVNAHRTGGEVM